MNLTAEFKTKVAKALIEARINYGGTDKDYANSKGMSAAIYSRIAKGETHQILSEMAWITLARDLQVTAKDDNWVIVRTRVYNEIEDSLKFCKKFSKAMIFVDECDIGKTVSARHIIKNMKNAFYVDCSQCKTKLQFIRACAKAVGVDNKGKYVDVKANLKYYITTMEEPVFVLDEAGDLDYSAFLDVKELWNGTEGYCGWYMMGADGLRNKIEKGIGSKKVGFAEILSRFSDEFIKITPLGKDDRRAFFSELIGAIASANIKDQSKVRRIVNQCVDKEKRLRHLNTVIKLEE